MSSITLSLIYPRCNYDCYVFGEFHNEVVYELYEWQNSIMYKLITSSGSVINTCDFDTVIVSSTQLLYHDLNQNDNRKRSTDEAVHWSRNWNDSRYVQ